MSDANTQQRTISLLDRAEAMINRLSGIADKIFFLPDQQEKINHQFAELDKNMKAMHFQQTGDSARLDQVIELLSTLTKTVKPGDFRIHEEKPSSKALSIAELVSNLLFKEREHLKHNDGPILSGFSFAGYKDPDIIFFQVGESETYTLGEMATNLHTFHEGERELQIYYIVGSQDIQPLTSFDEFMKLVKIK